MDFFRKKKFLHGSWRQECIWVLLKLQVNLFGTWGQHGESDIVESVSPKETQVVMAIKGANDPLITATHQSKLEKAISRLGLSPVISVLRRNRESENTENKAMWGRRQRSEWCSHKPGAPGAPRSFRRQGRVTPGVCQHLDFRLCAARTVGGSFSVVFSHQVCGGWKQRPSVW